MDYLHADLDKIKSSDCIVEEVIEVDGFDKLDKQKDKTNKGRLNHTRTLYT